jgi:hypothetical protein
MRNHFVHSGHPKRDLDGVVESIFEVVEWPSEIINCLLDVAKCDYGEVDKAIFQVVEKP